MMLPTSTIVYEAPELPPVVEEQVEEVSLASEVAQAIKKVEGGDYYAYGKSGEYGAYQHLPATWAHQSTTCFGEVLEMTPYNQDMVVECYIEILLEKHTPYEIALIWNSGGVREISGYNKYGVWYDTGAYARKVLANL